MTLWTNNTEQASAAASDGMKKRLLNGIIAGSAIQTTEQPQAHE
ncbi:hypothetical protein [Halospina denitrificans]|nr:hypothetical protein [Halospina denitrificans]